MAFSTFGIQAVGCFPSHSNSGTAFRWGDLGSRWGGTQFRECFELMRRGIPCREREGRFLGSNVNSGDSVFALRPVCLSGNDKASEFTNALDFFSEKVSSLLKNSLSSISSLTESEWVSGSPWLEDEDVTLLEKSISVFNYVQVLEVKRFSSHPFAGSRILILDRPGNIHSIYFPLKLWTESYYDLFASLPFVIPSGPIAILGLGAGTAARILYHVCPNVEIHGWELDPEVVRIARQYFDLNEIEKSTDSKASTRDNSVTPRSFSKELNQNWFQKKEKNEGNLVIHVGDALSNENATGNTPAKFSGILVDMFAKGAVIPQLQDHTVWQNINQRLLPGGRIMVNCGGQCVEPDKDYGRDGRAIMLETLNAMETVFGDELWIQEVQDEDDNIMALTGTQPDFDLWAEEVPAFIRPSVYKWVKYSEIKSRL